MNRVINTVEKNIRATPASLVAIGADVSAGAQGKGTDVLDDISSNDYRGQEFSGRYIQNTGANDAYYAFGEDCTGGAYHGLLKAGQQLDCSNHGMRVNVYSLLGTTIAPTILRRKDLDKHVNIIGGQVP